MRKHCHRERLSVTTGLRTNDLLDIRHERGQLCATFKHHRQHQRRHQRQPDCFHVNQTVSIIIVVITSIPFHKVISVRPYQLREELHPTTVTRTHTHTHVSAHRLFMELIGGSLHLLLFHISTALVDWLQQEDFEGARRRRPQKNVYLCQH